MQLIQRCENKFIKSQKSVDLKVMNSTNPELSWEPVKKGRRSKKSVARSLNRSVKAGNSISPKRFDDIVPGRETSGESENVPPKKRRHLFQSPPRTWASSLRNQDSAPPKLRSSSPLLDDGFRLQYPRCSSGDFSGIELLAEAAIMDHHFDDADKKDILPEDSILKNSHQSSSATLSKQYVKNNESMVSLSNINFPGANVDSQENTSANAIQNSSASPEDGTMLKVDRTHWDLNTSIDAWDEPYDDSIAGDTLKNDNGGRHMKEMEKHIGDHVPSNQTALADEKPSLKAEQDMSTSAAEDGMCSELPHLKENLMEPPACIYSHPGTDTSNQACEKNPDDENLIKALTFDANLKRLNQVTFDATIGSSSFSKLCCSSGMLKSEEKNNAISVTVAMIQEEDCSTNMTECEKMAALDESNTQTDEFNACNTAASEYAIDVKPEDIEVPHKALSTGTCTLDAEPVASTDSNKQIDGDFLSNSAVADCNQYSDTKHDEDSLLSNRKLKRTTVVDTCMSFSAGAQCDEPTTVGGAGFVLDGLCNPDVSQDNHVDMVNGDDLTGFKEGCDSPYEDGELRGSFLNSCEDNEMENECVDYESDGRNGDGSDAADYLGSEIVEGGSEGSNGSRGSLSMKISTEGGSKSGSVKDALKKHIVEPNNDEVAGKVSNAGSGSTVEQCMEMPMEENDGVKRLEQLDHKNAVNFRVRLVNEYVSKAVKGKLQSRIEGRSSADATDGKDNFFVQKSRSRPFAGSYPQPERDISPDRYLGRYRSATPGERDGVHERASWGSRRLFDTNYQVGEGRTNTRPRSKTGESTNKVDMVDYHEPRRTSYLSKGLHRPFMRRSPVERNDFFDVGERLPLTRGVGNYRSRGHYSRYHGRDFVEDFESLPDDASASVRMPHYISRREPSFSPGSGRQMQISLPRRRSRSRSKTRSPPRAWQSSRRERILCARRLSRSPDFRSEARMERMRIPFSKPSLSSDYGEGYVSPSRSRFSPQRNCRWVEDRNFADNHARRRRSPVRLFRRTERFDGVGSSGRLKPDEYFRPFIRPGRFSFMGKGGRECKIESNYDDRRRDDGGEMSHRVVHHEDTGNMRRFRHNTVGDNFETKNTNSNNEGIQSGRCGSEPGR